MGTRELRESFNAVTSPVALCSSALLRYERLGGQEYQFLYFSGAWNDGTAFSIRSDGLGRNASVDLAARNTAQKLLDQRAAK